MGDLGVFVDESGGQGGHSKYYVLTLVLHDQSEGIEAQLARHRNGLRLRGLPDIPFHANPLMNGHGDYENLDLRDRKAYFQLFFIDLQHLPIKYHAFVYKRSEHPTNKALVGQMRRDMTNLLFDALPLFQGFDHVKIYYDDGQAIVTHALHAAFEYVLANGTVLHRKTHADDFMLAQAADLICTLELTARKFQDGEATATDEKMFGSAGSFRKNYLKPLRRKRLIR